MPLPAEVVSALPAEYQSHQIVTEAADVASVVKMAIDGQKELGNRIRVPGPDADAAALSAFQKDLQAKVKGLALVPGENATDEHRASFWQSLGRPAEAKAYSIEKVALPEGLPDDFKIPAETLDQFKDFAFKQNLTQAQFEAALTNELNVHAGNLKAEAEALANRNSKLKEAFGAAEDAKKNMALRAAEKFGGKDFAEALQASGTPEQWIAWAKAGETFAEGGSLDVTQRGSVGLTLSPQEASTRISEIYANREHAFHKNTRPGHKDAVFEMFNLTLQRNGQRPITRSEYDAQFDPRAGRFNSTQLGSTVAEVGG